MNYEIVLDASADIAVEVANKYQIKFIPMEYSLGNEMRTSNGLEPASVLEKFYQGQRNGDFTKTTQITPYVYEHEFSKYLKEGKSVLYLSLSSGLSATYNSANLSAHKLKEKYPTLDVLCIDTLSATVGIGLLAEIAGENREKGLSIKENKEDLESKVMNINHWFMVEDLMYLKRGGRVSTTSAVVGTVLNIKPILSIDEAGKLPVIAKRHGKKMAISYLIENLKSQVNEMTNVIYVGDAGDSSGSDELVTRVKAIYPDKEVRKVTLSPIIGAHVGPGMLFIAHMGNKRNSK